MPRIYWKPILAVFLLAFGLRWYFQHRQAAALQTDVAATSAEDVSPPFTQVEGEREEISGQENAKPDADTPAVPGSLTFEHDPVELKPRPEDEKIDTTFSFTNTSDKPVTITGLESTCSCLEASLDQRTYAPGEKGTGKAVFTVSSFVGRHEKTLHLYTDNPAAREQVLTFVIDVPEVVSIEPNFVEWAIGDEPTPKHMNFKMLGDNPIHITKITPTRENVRFELSEIAHGREYRLTLTPVSTSDITMGGLKIETDSKIPKYARQMAFFSISRPELIEKRKQEEEKEKDKTTAKQ